MVLNYGCSISIHKTAAPILMKRHMVTQILPRKVLGRLDYAGSNVNITFKHLLPYISSPPQQTIIICDCLHILKMRNLYQSEYSVDLRALLYFNIFLETNTQNYWGKIRRGMGDD